MHLYAATTQQFIADATQGGIADQLARTFLAQHGHDASPSEVLSWRASLRALAEALRHGGLLDQGIILEYQLPLSSQRLDCLLVGRAPGSGAPHAVVIELKQWEQAQLSETPECVITFLDGRMQEKLHPSAQAAGYVRYLENNASAFAVEETDQQSDHVALTACSYLHHLRHAADSAFLDARYAATLARTPLFAGDQTDAFLAYLCERVGAGDGTAVLATVLASQYQASKRLLESVAAMLENKPEYVLLGQQRVAYNALLRAALTARTLGQKVGRKVVAIVQGGPGTGKSVLALNLMATLSRAGVPTHHATGTGAFTMHLRRLAGQRAADQFKYFNSYQRAGRNAIGVLIADEAHRLRLTSNGATSAAWRAGPGGQTRQVDELIHAAQVSIFFIDDLQGVRPDEVGTTALIRAAATAQGAEVLEYELDAQFRCAGSAGFINWIDHTLQLRDTANAQWDPADPFEFRLFDDVGALERAIRAKAATDHSARLVAGFCWRWSWPKSNGTLVADVVVEDWAMPWNARPNGARLAAGIPQSTWWATHPNGIEQVGCIYTSQGFEFDYVGVIIGRDLAYDPSRRVWVGRKQASADPALRDASDEAFLRFIKQTYRVLLTRGLKGCYVYCQDNATRDYLRSRMQPQAQTVGVAPRTASGRQVRAKGSD